MQPCIPADQHENEKKHRLTLCVWDHGLDVDVASGRQKIICERSSPEGGTVRQVVEFLGKRKGGISSKMGFGNEVKLEWTGRRGLRHESAGGRAPRARGARSGLHGDVRILTDNRP